MSEWIKCSDRMPLPNHGDIAEVVVLVTNGDVVGTCSCHSGTHPIPWVSFSSYGEVNGNEITHWQPLPSLPHN